ncbi:MAG TPA: SIMPL domain-containing protein [Methylophilaceae bacterium]|nr:SIMPL domain-containing protein [Methylophilaceae bacterium]HQC29802.1 SIMPL domain-containing protein [Methylotenera sp.]
MNERRNYTSAIIGLGLLLAIGMATAAFILGVQAKKAVSGQQSITVKGLAEKPIQADSAEWQIDIAVTDATQAGALKKLALEQNVVEAFLKKQGLEASTWVADVEQLLPHYEEVFVKDIPRQIQNGYDAIQTIRVTTNDLVKITAANKALLQLRIDNHPVTARSPNYLVSNLEEIKMSLIADATKNARMRATEFVKQDGVKVGVMKSASQGAFYILPVGGQVSDDSYGGTYDKSTIDKTARVVVTIVYNID